MKKILIFVGILTLAGCISYKEAYHRKKVEHDKALKKVKDSGYFYDKYIRRGYEEAKLKGEFKGTFEEFYLHINKKSYVPLKHEDLTQEKRLLGIED